ncbi:hypothetical protein E2C01_079921 [Portunus trituberculatus]|uniref:Uncharacterized protein n=1 Tax=Portunus trituberculatus TaxID=210409 RepID=A0A5B7ISL1_PORTR|nr:hypothetical protein [Portunus trituberculatus]
MYLGAVELLFREGPAIVLSLALAPGSLLKYRYLKPTPETEFRYSTNWLFAQYIFVLAIEGKGSGPLRNKV